MRPPARAIYWGARQIMLEVGQLNPGDIIEYEIDKKGFTYALLADGGDDESRFIPPPCADNSITSFLSG